ncbi:MAG: PorT family protein [Tannerellaceae bacterium]|nr:PorT family protein [Tannerellaceae bacterium]
MKKGVLFILLMMSIGSLKAQWSVTPEAGMTAVKRAGYLDNEWRPGWKLGVGVEYDLNNHFSLKSGVHYTQRGYSYSYWSGMYSPYYYGGDYSQPNYIHLSGKINSHFLQIPFMAKYSWNLAEDVKINIAAGPYIAFKIGNDWEWSRFSNNGSGNYQGGYGYGYGYEYGYNSGTGGTRSFDWGLSGSVGIEVKNWVANWGYDLSLGKEASWDKISPNYHTISLSVGYKFRLGK